MYNDELKIFQYENNKGNPTHVFIIVATDKYSAHCILDYHTERLKDVKLEDYELISTHKIKEGFCYDRLIPDEE